MAVEDVDYDDDNNNNNNNIKVITYNQKHLESFEMWCCRRMEKISWADHVRNEDVLLRVKEQRNILHEIRKLKANWIGHILRINAYIYIYIYIYIHIYIYTHIYIHLFWVVKSCI